MGRNIAIKGNREPKKIIKTLEMLGGINELKLYGTDEHCIYYINENKIIDYKSYAFHKHDNLYIIYTIEQFLKTYPFKTGEKVFIKIYDDLKEDIINNMFWDKDDEDIVYCFNNDRFYDVTKIYKLEETHTDSMEYDANNTCENIPQETTNNKNCSLAYLASVKYDVNHYVNGITITDGYADRIHLDLGENYEIETDENGNTYIVKKKNKLPETYEECCKVLGIDVSRKFTYEEMPFYENCSFYENDILKMFEALRKLIICRDAYWKILDWKPDWNDDKQEKYIIHNLKEKIYTTGVFYIENFLLSFPDDETKNIFYNNFIV